MIDIHDGGSLRGLERIQEDGPRERGGRSATFALLVTCGACALFASMAFGARRTTTPTQKKVDPLAELAAAGKLGTSPTILPGEVTFPGILSDKANPATAMAAATAGIAVPGGAAVPPPATDRLPVVPLPARHTLSSGAYLPPPQNPTGAATVAKPKDKLSVLAEGATDATVGGGALAAAGADGGWQLQVSSFKTAGEANTFATQLRARAHKAHVQKADIPNRGTWYRVKIGPFSTQSEATKYRSSFEQKEKVPGFVVKAGAEGH